MPLLTKLPINYIDLDRFDQLVEFFTELKEVEANTYEWETPEWLAEWGIRLGYLEEIE